MKKLLLGTTLILLSLHSIPSTAKQTAESLDQIVAVVNDDVVTRSELNHSLDIIKMQLAQENTPTPDANTLNKQALDQLINKKLQLQIAKQAGVTITDEDLNHAIAFIAKQNQMSVSDLYQRITHDGMSTSEYKSEMRDQITLQKLQQQEIIGHITVTPDEINAFMHSNVWGKTAPTRKQAENILLQRKFTEAVQTWVSKQRSQAFIKTSFAA